MLDPAQVVGEHPEGHQEWKRGLGASWSSDKGSYAEDAPQHKPVVEDG